MHYEPFTLEGKQEAKKKMFKEDGQQFGKPTKFIKIINNKGCLIYFDIMTSHFHS